MLKNLKLRAKVLILLIFISLLTAGVVGTIAFTLGTSSLEEDSYRKLTAIREMKANQIENYFNLIYDQVRSFSESRTIIESTHELKKGFDNVMAETKYTKTQLREIDSALQCYYQLNFLDQLYYQDSLVNYFSIPQKELEKGKSLWLKTTGSSVDIDDKEFPHLDPGTFSQDLKILGSSTVSSLAQHIIDRFKDEGAEGHIEYISTGTSEGIEQLISDNAVAMVGTSHTLTVDELELFANSGEEPASFRIGTDAIVVVISQNNTFLYDLSIEELRLAFTTAEKWSDINEDWPDETISRFIPSEGSGSYTSFSNIVLNGDQLSLMSSQNTSEIADGSRMKDAILNDPFTIAFYSYNYFDHDDNLRIISIDGVNLDNISVRRDMYPLKRSLYMVTTVNLLRDNQHVAHLINYFLNSVEEEVGVSLEKTQYWPQHANHQVLQYHFLVNNPYKVGEKGELVSSGLDFSYDKAHRKYHPIIKNYLDRFGFYDIFLLDADSGHILYSVSKEVDFGTDILHGPYSNTNIAEVFRKVVNNPDPGAVCFEDFAAYLPSYNAPASFIGSSIFDQGERIGVLIFQLPIDKINNIMTDGYEWEKVGLGVSGETYLVGQDFLMRNQSRFLIEDPEGYFSALEKTNISRETISKIKALNSTIGLQPIKTAGTSKALAGESGTAIFADYRNTEVLSSFKPLDIPGVGWVIMSEIDKSEAFAPIRLMSERFIYWFALLLLLILVLAILFARSISKPVQLLTNRASVLAAGNLEDSIVLEQKDEIGLLADNFEKMRCSVKKLVDDLQDVNQNLENKVAQRTSELNKAKEAADDILERSPVPLAVVDVSTAKYVRVNDAMTEFHKLDAEELLTHNTTETYFDADKDRPVILDRLREFGTIEDLEVHSKRIGTGEERWSIISVHPISYLGKELYITSLIDITERKEMEQKIKQQKTLLENTLESLTHPFYVVDAKDYSLLLANSAAKKLGDTENNTCYALTHKRGEPCDSKEDPCPLKIIKETKNPVVLEHTHYDPEGNPKIVEVSGYPIFDEHGEVVQMIEYSIDITDRKKAEQELLAANQRFQAIVNNLADALVIINERGIIEFFSPSAEKLFQYKGVEVLGENVKVLMPAPHHENHDEYLSRYYKTGEARVVGIEREVEGKRKDGSLFPARLMISEVKTANHHFFVGLIGDLTERKLAEKQLKTQAAAMESAENAIVITNASGFIQWVNPAFEKLTGYSPDDVIGSDTKVLKSGKHDDAFYKNMWETVLAGNVWQGEIINKKKNDELYYEEMTITPVFDEKEQLSQFVAIKQDVSERKRLEEIMIKAKERMEDELNVAKDIQMSMLPLIFPAFPQRGEIDIYADLIPAREVGGDFYDFYFLDESHICFVVGDVSGKGVPAALMMAVTKTLLKSRAGNDKSTASILTHVNNEIAKDNDTYMFITVFIAILNTATGELVYSNAGHNPSFILSPGNKPPLKLSDLHGPVVGAMEQMSYTESSVFINKDDMVVAYTDGITEAQNKNDELYSDEKFIEFLQNWEYTTPGNLVKEIIKSVKEHEDGAEQFDDITALVVQYCQEPNTMISARISFTILNKIEEIDTATGHFEEFCEENDVDMAVIPKFNIVFDELLNNIITYGYKDDKEHEIDFEVELKGERMVISIVDDGIPFNPFAQSPPDTMLSVEERGIGGLGIHIVTNLMDEYTYQRNIDKNVITLIKYNVKS